MDTVIELKVVSKIDYNGNPQLYFVATRGKHVNSETANYWKWPKAKGTAVDLIGQFNFL